MNSTVRVSAPARLHLGFLDLNGDAGRKFGSIGLAINSHRVVVEVQLSTETSIISIDPALAVTQRTNDIIEQFYNSIGNKIATDQQSVRVELIELIPSHAGLGSGTQLALALGTALCRLHNITATTQQIAQQLSRGARSGIGIATFDHGGFIVDGGLSDSSTTPPLLAHYHFPKNWRIILIMDDNSHGVHGEQELQAFDTLTTLPLADSQAICHHVLMRLLPALVEQKIAPFGQAITDIQSLIGDHFAPAQGGRYTSQHIASLLQHAQGLGHAGIAQSSWGPTGCIFVESNDIAKQLVTELASYIQQNNIASKRLSLVIAKANEQGADIVCMT